MCECLEVDSVIKSFGDKDVLTDVYLCCKPGDRIAIFGWNGSGKSTLMKIIFGTMPCERKFIRINGKVQSEQAFLSGLIAYLPQHDFLPPNLRVKEAIGLYLPDEDSEQFLKDENFSYIYDSRVSELSGGELRYLEIKLLLSCPAPYILLDEPFNGLSPICCESVRGLILKASQTKGIVFSDHNFREVHRVANRITLLHQAYLKEIKDMAELRGYGYAIYSPKSEIKSQG